MVNGLLKFAKAFIKKKSKPVQDTPAVCQDIRKEYIYCTVDNYLDKLGVDVKKEIHIK